jgi:hypothetical protein
MVRDKRKAESYDVQSSAGCLAERVRIEHLLDVFGDRCALLENRWSDTFRDCQN